MISTRRAKKGLFLVAISILVLIWGTSFTREKTSGTPLGKVIYLEAPYEVKIAERKRENDFILFALKIIKTHNPSLSDSQVKEIDTWYY